MAVHLELCNPKPKPIRNPDAWPSELKIGTPINPAQGNNRTNFSFSALLVFELWAHVGQTARRTDRESRPTLQHSGTTAQQKQPTCYLQSKTHRRAMDSQWPYGITQCYLPSDMGEWAPSLNPISQAGRYSIYLPQRDGRLS